ncbi:MAG: tetratricopeptide repeat protein [Cyanobacteriota bacterium]|nr:tetratricopeptide repeat protein [Cyanobacteriota bacterium]MDY6382871.1 tetratricopeptide repeat protein [Cyanobacteriota bacterium]
MRALKKLLSFIFTVGIIVLLVILAKDNRPFIQRNIIDKAKGMYYVEQGDRAYREMKTNRAIRLYNKGVKLYPEHYTAWYNLGNLYVSYEDYYAALYAYSQAFKYNPKMIVARMNYGVVATQKLGNFDAALNQFNKIVKIQRKMISIPYIYNNRVSTKENKAIAYYNIGVTYRLKSLYENKDWIKQRRYLAKAIAAYKKSLKIEPKKYDTLYNLGLAYQIAGRYNDAGENYCKAIKVQPMSYEAHYNLAVLLRRLRHYQEAYDEIDKAATLVSALNENSAQQQYVAIVMNDIMRTMYGNEEYKRYLNTILDEEKSKSTQHMSKKEIKAKESKKDKEKGTVTSDGVNLVNGKVVVTKELDKAILDSFGKCPSMDLFEDDEELD